ncbi:(2Fe-2S)-binding protein [Myxococcota bacterium]|nr:(2Fe-2S)-binding protein [Myxococcota bacterium]MBU1430626.1 (2Fe-2S)-binding protein [Myxococcota bacterium]MBU1898965.1 (2Fe-2S)-binding protein [Myxococcota bacterium]
MSITFTLNGEARAVEAAPMDRLLDVLRGPLGLTGAKEGCGEGECGACAVEIDGRVVNSCLIPVFQVEGATIRTIEGVAGERLTRLQEAFLAHGAVQCGACTPALVLGCEALLAEEGQISRAGVREALAGHLCRCTGYQKIIDAVMDAAEDKR